MRKHAGAGFAALLAGVTMGAGAVAADGKVRIWTPSTPVAAHLDAVSEPLIQPAKVKVKIVFNAPDRRVRAYKRALGQLYPGYIGSFGGQLYPF